jgi:hypothetical protein
MNRRQKPPQQIKNPAYRQAFARLDAALEENTPSDNREKIRLLHLAMFGDMDELQESGTLVIPE